MRPKHTNGVVSFSVKAYCYRYNPAQGGILHPPYEIVLYYPGKSEFSLIIWLVHPGSPYRRGAGN